MFEMLQEDKSRSETFASSEPPPSQSFGDLIVTAAKTTLTAPTDPIGLFMAAERQVRLADNAFSAARSTEEAYDRQIAQIKQATGQQLENPLRGGYALEARKRIKEEMFAGGGVRSIDTAGGEPEYRIRIFDEKLAELRQKNPDLPEFDLRKEAAGIAAAAEGGLEKAAGEQQNPIASLGLQFLGGMWAGRRDPLFVSSMFAGPTGTVGRTALARIVSTGVTQGLYNAGLSAIQQPAVQAWRQEAALRSGVEPAIENIGMAFLSGLIPGASIQGVKEMLGKGERELIERVVSGRAEAGEPEAATKVIDDVLERAHIAQREVLSPIEKRAVKMGEDMQEADRAVLPDAYEMPRSTPGHDDVFAAAAIMPHTAENRAVIRELNEIATTMKDGASFEDAIKGKSTEAIEAIGGDRMVRSMSKDWNVELDPESSLHEGGETYLDYVLRDQSGKVRARASLGIENDTATLADINLIDRNGDALPVDRARNLLGPSVIRRMLRKFREDNPEVKRIIADRVSGARVGGEFDVTRGQEISIELHNDMTAAERWFHGTPHAFGQFDPDAAAGIWPDRGVFFTNHPPTAENYARGGGIVSVPKDVPRVVEAELNFKNPKIIRKDHESHRDIQASEIKEAKAQGHDGIIYEYTGKEYQHFDPPLREAVAFSSSTIDQRGSRSLHDDMTAAALKRADDPTAPSPEAIQFFDVYHGSPHDFDQFSLEHIGTGEGAASYGHGLYSAEHPATAEDYKRRLGGDPAHRVVDRYDTSEFDEKPWGAIHARASNGALLGTITRNRVEGESGFRVISDGPDGLRLSEVVQSIDEAKKSIEDFILNNRGGGHLYRARILADKEHFLDWDKPLSEQSARVRAAIEGDERLKAAAGKPEDNETVDSFYRNLKFGSPRLREAGMEALKTPEAASKALHAAGIPGIKYLDQGSRGAEGEGTRNYVVFDDKLLEITHKNDMPVGAPEIAARVEEAHPQNMHEAQVAADEALDDFGRQHGMTVAQDQMAEQAAARAAFVVPEEEAPKLARGDPMGKIPYIDDSTRISKDGKPSFIASIDKVGKREAEISMLIRSCK